MYGAYVPAASEFTIRAELTDTVISSITPERYATNNTVSMTISGGGIQQHDTGLTDRCGQFRLSRDGDIF